MRSIGVYANTVPYAGGAYQYTRSIIQAVRNIGYEEPDYRCTVYSKDANWSKVCDELGIPFVLLSNTLIKRSIFWLGCLFKNEHIYNLTAKYTHPLWSKYRKDKLDVLIISNPIIVDKTYKAKIITPIFDLMHRYIDFSEVGGGDIGIERDRCYVDICNKSDGVLVDSMLGKQQMLECYGEEINNLSSKIYVLPYIAPDYINSIGEEIQTFDKYILYPAQFWKHKNHLRLVQAVHRLRDKGIIVNLMLTGTEKNNKKNVENLIEELNLQSQVKILDYVTNEQLVYLYRHARALAMPTFAGPTNIPPLEALAVGCPMLLSNNFAMPDQVGDAALYFDPESVDEITDCMERLWTDDELCKQLIARGIVQNRKWGIKQFQDRLKEIIDCVIEA